LSILAEIVETLNDAEAIGLASHIDPDGDSVGSLLALSMALSRQGKRVYAAIPNPGSYPPQYRFLPGQNLLIDPQSYQQEVEVFVALDCSNPERLGKLRKTADMSHITINIDHHEDNLFYASLNFVEERASSTAQLVFELQEYSSWGLTAEEATCLYTGLVTDTGRFQHLNTTSGTFAIASRLLDAGADIFRVVKEVYESRSLSYTHLLGKVLQRAEILEKHGFIFSYVTLEDVKDTGAVLAEAEDLIDYLRIVHGTRMAALFKELEDGKVRVSLRSRDGFEVGPIARSMGGGGHAMAAGYTSDLDIKGTIDTLLGVLRDDR
jgi:phosphoesterase RecJ-like protein